jgi:hypothetical protein
MTAFAAPQKVWSLMGAQRTLANRCLSYFLGPSTLPSTIFRASAKASAGVARGIVAASRSPSSSYTLDSLFLRET